MNAAISEQSNAILKELPKLAKTVELRVQGKTVELPLEVYQQVLEILEQLANGHSVAVIAMDSEFTTQQAAEFLNVSRPYVIKLLEQGAIPFRLVGSHRRMKFADVLAYRRQDAQRRRKAFEDLQKEAQSLDLGY